MVTLTRLELPGDAHSPGEARRWVTERCLESGHAALSECAELGVSELVTNAVLHAPGGIVVSWRGTADHPRIEVHDGSTEAPLYAPEPAATDLAAGEDGDLDDDELDVLLEAWEDDLLATFGRGLSLVARCSTAWGVRVEASGKTIWFDPAPAMDAARANEPLPVIDDRPAAGGDVPDGVRIEFPALPVRHFRTFERHYKELRRELMLLTLAHRDDYPLAETLSSMLTRFNHQLELNRIRPEIEDADRTGASVARVVFVVPADALPTISQVLDLLDVIDDFCRAERMLSLARSSDQVAFQRWFLGEFLAQSRGERPRLWDDETVSLRISDVAG